MRKLLLSALILGATAGAWLAWRSATEADRRYARMLTRIDAFAVRENGFWPDEEAAAFWNDVAWFRERCPEELGRRASDSCVDAGDHNEVAILVSRLLELQGARSGPPSNDPGHPLPPFGLSIEGPFDPGPFRLRESILESTPAVDGLAGSACVEARFLLLTLLRDARPAPEPAVSAVVRLAERDPEVSLRIMGLLALWQCDAGAPLMPLLVRLTGGSEPVVRLAALSFLAGRGDAQRGRELAMEVMQRQEPPLSRLQVAQVREINYRLWRSEPEWRRFASLLYAAGQGITGERWEFAERLGDVLERRAVGESDEPVDE